MKDKPHPGGTQRVQPIFTASYMDHPIARYNKSPLIRALNPLPDHIELQAWLTQFPEHSDEERLAPRSVKIGQLQQLYRFYAGLPRVVELFETLHTMICEGYLGRIPFSSEDIALRQATFERQKSGQFYDLESNENGAEFTTALIGIPGVGKSQALKRVSQPYRCVIYHPELNIYQIPALLIEMPYKGVSINTLAHAIIRALDKVFPQGQYYKLYLQGKENAEVLFLDAVQLMQTHYVGVLLVDESQNRDYREDSGKPLKTRRGQTPLATLLLTATNESQIPMLLSATPELHDVLAARLSMVRRTVGRGMTVWRPLSLPKQKGGEIVDIGEFGVLLQMLWSFQWTKTPFELTPRMHNIFYYYSQGISDVVVKLYHDIQLRAVRNGGDEIVDEDLVHDVANNELAALTKVTRAMREMDYQRTGEYADLAAYLRLDPHELNPSRRRAQDGLLESHLESFDDEVDCDDDVEAPRESVEQPKEVPTGKAVKRTRRSATKTARAAASPPPKVEPIGDLGTALDS